MDLARQLLDDCEFMFNCKDGEFAIHLFRLKHHFPAQKS